LMWNGPEYRLLFNEIYVFKYAYNQGGVGVMITTVDRVLVS